MCDQNKRFLCSHIHKHISAHNRTQTIKLVCMPKNLNVNKQFGNKDPTPSESILTYSELQLDILDLIKWSEGL